MFSAIKIKYKEKKYTFALPLRSNISKFAPKSTYFSLPNRKSTRLKNHHGIHYTKAFPIHPKYLIPYKMNTDFYSEYLLAYIEKHINTIVKQFKLYLSEYENGQYYMYHVDIDHLVCIQDL